MDTIKLPGMRPRNPLATAARQRAAGAHGSGQRKADRRAQKPGLMMASIYRTLLREIEARGFPVLRERVGLTPLRKLWLAWKVQALGRL